MRSLRTTRDFWFRNLRSSYSFLPLLSASIPTFFSSGVHKDGFSGAKEWGKIPKGVASCSPHPKTPVATSSEFCPSVVRSLRTTTRPLYILFISSFFLRLAASFSVVPLLRFFLQLLTASKIFLQLLTASFSFYSYFLLKWCSQRRFFWCEGVGQNSKRCCIVFSSSENPRCHIFRILPLCGAKPSHHSRLLI